MDCDSGKDGRRGTEERPLVSGQKFVGVVRDSLNYYQGNRRQLSGILPIDQLIYMQYAKFVAPNSE
jgi:hypothetical protein